MKKILTALGMGLGLIVTISVCTAIAMINFTTDNALIIAQIIAFAIMAITFSIYVLTKKDLKMFGFNKPNWKTTLYYIPLLVIILIQPLMFGINTSLSLTSIFLIIIQMTFVGFTEEILFRSIFKYLLKEKSERFYIIFSSIVFGLLHLSNGLQSPNLLLVTLQIVNALSIGFMLASAYLKGKSIVPLMIFHTLFNILASICIEPTDMMNIITVIILVVCTSGYTIYLLNNKKSTN